jgi:hypothetical protein
MSRFNCSLADLAQGARHTGAVQSDGFRRLNRSSCQGTPVTNRSCTAMGGLVTFQGQACFDCSTQQQQNTAEAQSGDEVKELVLK